MKNLMIKLVPYEKLRANGVKELLTDLKKNAIVVVDAKLSPEEEANLIEETMSSISDKFSGVEIGSFDVSKEEESDFLKRLKGRLAEFLLGRKQGLTVIGPADVVKKMKKDPSDLMFYLS